MIASLVKHGLKAQLNSTIPIVGSQFIDLVFKRDKNNKLISQNEFTLFPTIVKVKEPTILDEVKKVLVKIEKLKLEKLLASATDIIDENREPLTYLWEDIHATIQNFNSTIDNINITISNVNNLTQQEALQQLPQDIEIALNQLTSTLEEIQTLSKDYNANSIFASELSITLKELSMMAESMGSISRKLERKTNALLLGDE